MTDTSTTIVASATGSKTALECVTAIHAALADAGMPRTSRMSGGEMTGWTNARGSTGFSVRQTEDGTLDWHVVVSGKPLMRYDYYTSDGDSLHEPVNPEKIYPHIERVFAEYGLDVVSVSYCGHQTMWDDDVEYSIITARPDWLEQKPEVRRPARWGY